MVLILILVLIFLAVIVTLFILLTIQAPSAVTIKPDGSIEGTSRIQRQGDTYSLTGDLSGGIKVQRSDIVIDGAGYAIRGGGEGIGIDLNNDHGIDPSRAQVKNVTVKNLEITNFGYAVLCVPSVNDTFVGNYVADCYIGFDIWWTANHILTHNTVENCVTAITISFGGSGNIIKENNILNSSVFVMEQSAVNTVDRNYWSDYSARYPNAAEIDNTGIWDTLYEGHEAFTDNHPLVEPVALNPVFSDEEPFPTALVAAVSIIAIVVLSAVLLVYFKKRKHAYAEFFRSSHRTTRIPTTASLNNACRQCFHSNSYRDSRGFADLPQKT